MADQPLTHALEGFPAAAILFVRALERNREKIATDHGLSASELRALFWVAEQGSVQPRDLATHMEMTTGGITAVSHRLVEMDLLERVAHPNDRRSLYLELTELGHSTMKQMHSEFNHMIEESTAALSEDELTAFEAALTAVAGEVSSRTAR